MSEEKVETKEQDDLEFYTPSYEPGSVIPRSIVDEMKANYLDYSMSVIVSRALPEVKDGLKPSQRRILVSMNDLGLQPNAHYRKSAKIAGDTSGNYHPHGESVVYPTMVKLAQDFSTRYPLVDGQGNFGCFTKDTKVQLADGRKLSFGELIKEFKKGKKNYTYTISNGEVKIAEIKHPRLTKVNQEILKVTLDNGEEIKCTLDHKFMLKNGEYKEAQNLEKGESLMPLYMRPSTKEDCNKIELLDYTLVLNPKKCNWIFAHHLADLYNIENKVYNKSKGRVRHHIDFNKENNSPDNITRLHWKEHWKLHSDLTKEKHQNNPEFREKLAKGRKEFWAKDINKEKASKRMSQRNKNNWENEVYREEMIKKLSKATKKYFAKNPEAREKQSERLLKLWQNKEFRAIISSIKSEEMKNRWANEDPTLNKFTSKKSKEIWESEGHRKQISEMMKKTWENKEYQQKRSETSKKLWKNEDYKNKFPQEHFKNMAKAAWSCEENRNMHQEKAREQWKDKEFRKKIVQSISESNKNRIKKNPALMHEIAQEAKKALTQNWKDPEYKKRIIKSKVLNFVNSLQTEEKDITPELYEAKRDKPWIPKIDTALQYFDNFEEIVIQSKTYNHKVVKTEILDTREDVYDLTIDKTHNFSLASGVFVHNSVDGDPAAAMRYTEARMAKYTTEILKDLDKGTVTFIQNYDGTRLEPEILPSLFPNLLCNGSDGIAVGMATKIPPHNLTEVINALVAMVEKGNQWKGKSIYNELRETREKGEDIPKTLNSHPTSYLENYSTEEKEIGEIKKRLAKEEEHLYPTFESDITPEELIKHISGPDFPTGGTIYDQNEIINMYATGKGRVLIRAKASIEETNGGKFQIIVTEIPYQVNKSYLLEKIAFLVKEKKVTGISDLRDESNRDGMRIVVTLKKDAQPKTVLNKLYKYTEMQKAFNSNMISLVEQEPMTLTLKRMLELFISFRICVTVRRYEYNLAQARYRAHILEGLLKALDMLDEVIATIRASKTQEDAKENLINKFDFTQVQSQAILDMQLRRLAALEREKINEEYKELKKNIEHYLTVLNSQDEILGIIKSDFEMLKEKFGDERRTKVVKGKVDEIAEEDLVPSEDTFITISHSGYIKRLHPETYRTQKRGGRGVMGAGTKEDDFVKHALLCNTHDDIMLFTNTGRVFTTKAYEVPEYSRTAKGLPLVNLVSLNQGELVTSVLTRKPGGGIMGAEEIEEGQEEKGVVKREDFKFLFMATKNGTVKKTDIKDFEKIRANGLISIKLDEGDELKWVKPTTGKDEIIVITTMGRSIRFNEEGVRATGRNSRGVRGIKFKFKDDEVISMDAIRNNEHKLFILSEKGFGKMTTLDQYPTQGRGGSGVFSFRVKDKTGKVVAARTMDNPDKELVVVSKKGVIIRSGVQEIPTLGRQTSGVKIMKLMENDSVATCALV